MGFGFSEKNMLFWRDPLNTGSSVYIVLKCRSSQTLVIWSFKKNVMYHFIVEKSSFDIKFKHKYWSWEIIQKTLIFSLIDHIIKTFAILFFLSQNIFCFGYSGTVWIFINIFRFPIPFNIYIVLKNLSSQTLVIWS